MGRGEGWRRGRGGRVRWMADFCVHAFVCWGGQVYSKGEGEMQEMVRNS